MRSELVAYHALGSERALGLVLRTAAVLISCLPEIRSVGAGNLGTAAIGSVYCFALFDPCGTIPNEEHGFAHLLGCPQHRASRRTA